MSRQTLRIVLSAFIGLLVVPIAVNIGTGGDAPPWLKPYVAWLWPAAIASVAFVIALELWDRRGPKSPISVHRPSDPRNVELALTQVSRYIEARQRGTLAEQARIQLALDERPDAVRQPVHLVQRVGGEEFQLSATLTIGDVYAQLSESMLILGAPGAGKTTQLFDLAQALVVKARNTANPAIPIVVDLADWSLFLQTPGSRRMGAKSPDASDFTMWLTMSMADRYKIPVSVGQLWLAENRLILLFDGLDEVAESNREACAAEINALQESGVTRVVVCCREADYTRLGTRLRLQGAVVIRPLDRESVKTYLASVSPSLAGVVAALEADQDLWNLLTTPLMLTIIVLAGIGESSQALAGSPEPVDGRRQLFDAYVVEVLARRRSNERGTPERVLPAIRTLAAASTAMNSGVVVTDLDPDRAGAFLSSAVKANSTKAGTATLILTALAWTAGSALHFGGLAALIPVALGALGLLAVWNRHSAPVRSWAAFLAVPFAFAAVSAGLTAGVLALLAGSHRALTTAGIAFYVAPILVIVVSGMRETPNTRKSSFLEQVAFLGIAAAGAGGLLLLSLRPLMLEGWALAAAPGVGFIIGLATAARYNNDSPSSLRTVRGRYVALRALAYAAVGTGLVNLLSDRWNGPFWEVLAGMVIGLVYALIVAVSLSIEFTDGWLVRAAMAASGETVPWRRGFLRFAADRSLLTYVDGQYRFLHLLIRDHLASCDAERLAEAVTRRRAELQRPAAPQPAARATG